MNGARVCRTNCGRAFDQCPPITCPRSDPPPLDRNCLEPNCNNALAEWLLYPIAEDPTAFYKCNAIGVWSPTRIPCACGTLFDYSLQRCVHVHEFTPQCTRHIANPQPRACPECPTCDEELDPVSTTTPRPENCPCICSPCIFEPCLPCPQSCPCF